ncbi:SCP2 sterol-binding domain-containing protein [Evansella cellulosilytica]|uniref:Sterol-binding domain protein n=1 Tax=Evansella cellulosilytica (strain ATCC 21833 / DSM 2522 / FERM P-1141 / JCM 9156 / N-4) TaxID=649639 RepID=E6U066_EVAC2|nr:SCP2 sterol-binding domain-containing protein [Evansella cellulosilytica]ADU29070.1 Sterol-binding domain protein [Evansella cellulosilytica DSM 2522]
MGVKEKFQALTEKANENLDYLEDKRTVYQFNLSGEQGGTYQLHLNGKQGVDFFEEEKGEASIVLEMSDENFLKLASGNLNPTVAYMGGKIKIKGDLSLALKLQSLLKKFT